MIVSAHLILATRDCAAQGCTLDAEPGLELCWRCILKPAVRRHEPPEVYTGPTLHCCSHHQFYPEEAAFFPDEEFNHAAKRTDRRGRHAECRRCCSLRKRLERANWTPEQREREAARHRPSKRLGWPPA